MLEDYQSSFDWNPVYFQSKLRILTASIKHHVSNKNKEWVDGQNQGVILSFGNDITSDLETVNFRNTYDYFFPQFDCCFHYSCQSTD